MAASAAARAVPMPPGDRTSIAGKILEFFLLNLDLFLNNPLNMVFLFFLGRFNFVLDVCFCWLMFFMDSRDAWDENHHEKPAFGEYVWNFFQAS